MLVDSGIGSKEDATPVGVTAAFRVRNCGKGDTIHVFGVQLCYFGLNFRCKHYRSNIWSLVYGLYVWKFAVNLLKILDGAFFC